MKNGKMHKKFMALALLLAAASMLIQGLAGPPLICHPFEIGSTKSLPWAGPNWRDVDKNYDLDRLADDTLALLTPQTPVIVRMETLRRATIYGVWAKRDHEVGYEVKNNAATELLVTRLMDRTRKSMNNGRPDALALFDAGYLVSCLQQAGYRGKGIPSQIDGYTMVRKAAGFGRDKAEMEFALAIISRHPQRASLKEHLQKAIDGATEGSMLARNLAIQFGQRGQSLASLRAQTASIK